MQFTDRKERDADSYCMKLSADDTYWWARRPDAWWPGSTLSGKRIVVCVDSNGLCDLSVDGACASDDIDGHELEAIVSDFLPDSHRHLWPVWGC